MQLSKKPKAICGFFIARLNFILNFENFGKKASFSEIFESKRSGFLNA